jgi:hypothetical protein
MSGQRRLLREGNRKPSLLASKLNFGVVAFAVGGDRDRPHPDVSGDSVAAARAFSRAIAVGPPRHVGHAASRRPGAPTPDARRLRRPGRQRAGAGAPHSRLSRARTRTARPLRHRRLISEDNLEGGTRARQIGRQTTPAQETAPAAFQLTAYRDERPPRLRPRGQVRFAAPFGPRG